MARAMLITPVDTDNNLFQIENSLPETLVEKILATDWINLDYTGSPGQEHMKRRLIKNSSIPWIDDFHQAICKHVWPVLVNALPCEIDPYFNGVAFWLDEPGMTCDPHTDGELPGSLQLFWVGEPTAGTTFYHYKNLTLVRKQFEFIPNNGYIMINQADNDGYRQLQWHAMMQKVPENSYRLTSYIWLYPRK